MVSLGVLSLLGFWSVSIFFGGDTGKAPLNLGVPIFSQTLPGQDAKPWKGQECQSAFLFDFAFLGYTLFQTSPWFSYVFFINISCLLPLSFDLEFCVQMVAQRWLPKLPKKLVARFKTTAALVFVRLGCVPSGSFKQHAGVILGSFLKWRYPKMDGIYIYIPETPIIMDDWGYLHFRETSINSNQPSMTTCYIFFPSILTKTLL